MSAVSTRPRITAIALPQLPERPLPTLDASIQALDAIAAACTAACAAVGFPAIEVQRVSNEEIRLVATDPAGHALVSEVTLNADGYPSLATEVVGVRDGSCNGILDRFDIAVAEAGIRSSPPARKFTGGACELAGARDAVRRFRTKLQPKPLESARPADVKRQLRATRGHANHTRGRQ
jgi:hypothetical protein